MNPTAKVITPIAALAALVLMAALALSGPAGTASAAITSPDISPRHNCYGATTLRYLPVGGSATCFVRVNNDNGALAAEDVTFYFSNTNLSVSNVSVRLGPGGSATPLPGVTGNTNTPFVPAFDIPARNGYYIFFTVTREAGQSAPRYPIVCASGTYTRPTLPTPTTYVATECSQGGAY